MQTGGFLRNLALVAGGALLSVVGPELISWASPGWMRTTALTLVSLSLLLFGFGVFQGGIHRTRLLLRRHRVRRLRIGILIGISHRTKDAIPAVNTDIPVERWNGEILRAAAARGVEVTVKQIYAVSTFDNCDVILNPFGGTYPELSFDGFPTYQKLLKYIREGGIFANVADIPTYFAYNPALHRSIDRTPAVYAVDGREVRFFQRVPLMEELSVRVLNCEAPQLPLVTLFPQPEYSSCLSNPINILMTRAAYVEGNVDSVVQPLQLNNRSVTPLFFCSYGNGRVLCSLSFLTGKYPANHHLIQLVANLVIHATGRDP